MDVFDFKQLVLEILWDGKHMNRYVCELRLTLFINALNVADIKPECLMPFPSYFFDPKTKTRNIVQLRQHISSIPALDDIKGKSTFPLTWQLLYCIFTNPLTISALHLKESKEVFINRLHEETKLKDIPNSSNVDIVYFKIDTRTPKDKFLEGKNEFGTFFAFHGSTFENFHSIIHRGLVSALNQRSKYGFGTYLTLSFATAGRYAKQSSIWSHNKLLSRKHGVRCVGIVEVVDHPSIHWPNLVLSSDLDLWTERKNCRCCVVDRDELMQLRYLLVLNNFKIRARVVLLKNACSSLNSICQANGLTCTV